MFDYKQCSPSWGYLKLGASQETMCKSGCVTTVLSALSEWYGVTINPGKLCQKLKYTDSGLLYWKSMDGVLGCKFVYRYYSQNDAKIKAILASKDNACLLQVNGGKHWVALVGFSRLHGYKIYDPLYGDIVYLNKRYGSKIQGFTEVTRN